MKRVGGDCYRTISHSQKIMFLSFGTMAIFGAMAIAQCQ